MDRLSSPDTVPLEFTGHVARETAKNLTVPARRYVLEVPVLCLIARLNHHDAIVLSSGISSDQKSCEISIFGKCGPAVALPFRFRCPHDIRVSVPIFLGEKADDAQLAETQTGTRSQMIETGAIRDFGVERRKMLRSRSLRQQHQPSYDRLFLPTTNSRCSPSLCLVPEPSLTFSPPICGLAASQARTEWSILGCGIQASSPATPRRPPIRIASPRPCTTENASKSV
jgi:hypothetical protein